jgi:hypothetical protein
MKERFETTILLEQLHFQEGPAFDKKVAIWLVEQNNGSLGQYYR